MAKKFLSDEGLRHFINKVIGKNDISKIGDGTITGGISKLNSNLGNNFIIKQYQIDKTIYANDTSNLYDIPMIDGYKLLSCNIEYLTVTSNKIIISSPIRIYQSNTYRVVAYNLSPASNTLKGSLYVMFVKNDYIK